MHQDLRSFLTHIGERYPSELLEVDVTGKDFRLEDCDAAALLTKLRQQGRKPVLLMRGVRALDGQPWQGRILWSELSTELREAVAIGMPPGSSFQDLAAEWIRRTNSTAAPVVVSHDDAPVKQNVWRGDDVSLYRLPVYRKDEFDARPGWLCAIGIGRAYDKSRYNLSWHRIHVRAPDWAAVRINPRHLNEQMNGWRAAGETKMPIAFVLGHHPAFELASASAAPWDVDEYEYAGGVMGGGVRVVPSETFGDDLLVPADAELIVEGYVDLTRRELCGPWADFMVYYSPQTQEPVFTPTAITFRNDPIVIESWTSQETLGHMASTAQMYAVIKQRFPGVKAVANVAPFTYVVQARLSRPGDGTRLGALVMGSFADRVKNVILVDEDIDPFDLNAVLFSIATRVDADTAQVQIYHDLAANRQDPSTEREMRVGGLMIDSTKPQGKPFPPLAKVPQDALNRISLEDILG
jgi:2,5-furandicarboxylate decarboxylase 1